MGADLEGATRRQASLTRVGNQYTCLFVETSMTTVAILMRRARTATTSRRALVLALAIGTFVLGGCSTSRPSSMPAHKPSQAEVSKTSRRQLLLAKEGHGAKQPSQAYFVAIWSKRSPAGQPALEAMSMDGGVAIRRLMSLAGYNQGSGLSSGVHGDLWVTLATGPRYRSNVAGGDPAPDSCSGEVVRFDPNTGARQVLLRTPSSVSIADAASSPDGSTLAYLEGGCATGYFDMHLVVRNLKSGASWSIGSHQLACHGLSAPSWSPSGRTILLSYSPSLLRADHPFVPNGTCLQPGPAELLVVPARPGASLSSAETIKAPQGCQYTDGAFDALGIAAVEQCGNLGLGAAALVQLVPWGPSGQWVPTKRVVLPGSADGVTLASDARGQVLVFEYEAPSYGPGPTHSQTGPFSFVWHFDPRRGSLIIIARYGPTESTAIGGVTWW